MTAGSSVMVSAYQSERRIGQYKVLGTALTSLDGPLYSVLDGDTLVRLQFLSNPDPDRVRDPCGVCRHPGLQPVLGSGRFADLDYLVLPADNGRPWQHTNAIQTGTWLHRVGQILDVARAVASLHGCGLVHLRLDARHIREHGTRIEVLHAGTVRDLHGRTSVPCLSPPYGLAYPAPEQRLFGAGLSPQTDVYQLGVLLAPLCGIQLSRERWTWVGKPCERRHVPPSVIEVCTTALRQRDSERFASAGIFRDALASALFASGRSVETHRSRSNTPSWWLAWAR